MLRPPRFSPELFVRDEGDRADVSASEKEQPVVVTGMYALADEELPVADMEGGEDRIRKTVRIEQSF